PRGAAARARGQPAWPQDEPQPNIDEPISRGPGSGSQQNAPRRSSGLPSWLLAGSGAEAEGAAESGEASLESPISTTPNREEAHEFDHSEAHEEGAPEATLSDEEVSALASSIIEAKQDEVQAHAPADAIVGGAAFDEDDEEDEEEDE